MSEPAKSPFKLFYCYAHEDKALRDKIDNHLSVLKHHKLIEIWYDEKISAGMEREQEIDKHLSTADIILLLVSAASLASDYYYGKEMKQALRRHEERKAIVIPIILQPFDWKNAHFSTLQVLPTGGIPITKWEDPEEACEDIAKSLREIVEELQTSREGAAKEQLQRSIVILAAPTKAQKTHHNLPSPYGVFLGREQDIERVMEGLTEPWPLISLVGMGGMGKTRLAIEIAHLCLTEDRRVIDPPFEYVIWVSAKDRPEQQLWLNDVLDTTAHILGDFSIITLSTEQLEEKKEKVNELLRTNQTLLIVDNFETIKDSALESWLERIPKPSKALITSRANRFLNAWNIDLKDLNDLAALKLIKKHAQRLGLNSIKNASQDVLRPLVDVTRGNPKAIEVALGLVKRGGRGLNEVIEHFRAVGPGVNNEFYEIFMWPWQSMTDNSKHILMATTFFADAMSKEALGTTSELAANDLDLAIEELVEFMVLEIKEGEEETTSSHRYSIHPLTRAFATKQLQQRPDFEAPARKRWSNYYLKFAAASLERDTSLEHYLNALKIRDLSPVDREWPNLSNVLAWADQAAQGQIFIELMILLVHYMDRRLLFRGRVDNARKVAETAHKLGMDEHAALFYIDSLGWTLIQQDRLEDAEQTISQGLRLAQTIKPKNYDLIALANAYLARIQLERGNIPKALEFIHKSLARVPGATYSIRVNKIAGDIARKQKQYVEALKFYKKARHGFLQQGEVGDIEARELNYRFGLTYLDMGDSEQAENSFKSILDQALVKTPIGELYTHFGLAQVAKARGEWEKAGQLAMLARTVLTYEITSHRLLKQIDDFLQSLEKI